MFKLKISLNVIAAMEECLSLVPSKMKKTMKMTRTLTIRIILTHIVFANSLLLIWSPRVSGLSVLNVKIGSTAFI